MQHDTAHEVVARRLGELPEARESVRPTLAAAFTSIPTTFPPGISSTMSTSRPAAVRKW